jgi:hypothetical protein
LWRTRTRLGGRVATEEIGSAKGLSLWLASRTTSRVDPTSRKTVAMAAALVLCLVALVLAASEARAAEQQPSQTAQQGKVESTTMINGKVAEPEPGATTPPVVTPPVEKPPAEAPAPPPPTNETPPAEEPDPAPHPLTRPTPQPAPQWFAVVITDGEVVESDPVLPTSRSVTDFGQVLEPETMSNAASPDLVDPASAPATPAAGVDDRYASGPARDPVPPLPGLAAAPPATPRGDSGGPLPTPANTSPAEGLTPSGMVGPFPASVRGATWLPSSLGTTVASAVGTVQSAVASATAEVWGTIVSGSPGTSSDNPTDGTQEQPSEGTPQPAPPVVPPGGGSSFSPSAGGGQMGTGGGSFAPLLVGVLALLAAILLGRDFRTYLVSCEMPKPSSALLLPLERPG